MRQIAAILQNDLIEFLGSTALLWMAASALINTAPPALPTLREFPQWIWTWGRDAAHSFMSLRNPQGIPPAGAATPAAAPNAKPPEKK